MAGRMKNRGIKPALVFFSLVGLSGCIDYTVKTTVNPDGSGLRSVRVEATDAGRLADFKLSPRDFTELMFFSEREGWVHETHVASGDTTQVFRLEKRMNDLSSWFDLSDEIRIAGVPPASSGSSLGYLTLGDVQFRNRVWVRMGENADGNASFSYQEQFLWENGIDAILEFILEGLERSVREAYPRLSERDRGEILGFARASLWSAVEDGLLDSSGDEQDHLLKRAMDRTAVQGIKVVRRQYPAAREEPLKQRLAAFSEEWGADVEAEFDQTLPGISLAMNSQISFRLKLPGRVTTTNAHEREGETLVWEFSPIDALTAPIVILAESVVRG